MVVEHVQVTMAAGALPETEIRQYIAHIRQKNPGRLLRSLELRPDGEEIELRYRLAPVKFERIRRITGYLVGSTERWNNAKRAEEGERVKHC